MATATFPTAEKVVYYKIDKKLFEKISEACKADEILADFAAWKEGK